METENTNPEEPREGESVGDSEMTEDPQPQPETQQPQAAESSSDGRYRKNMIIAVAVVVLLIIAGIVGWIISSGGTGGTGGLSLGGGEAVAVVNGEEISNEKFQDRLSQALDGMEAQGTEVGESQREQVRQAILSQLVNEELAAQYAEENGITVSEEEVTSRIQQVTQQVGGQEALDEALNQQGMDPADLDSVVERELLSQKVAQEVAGGSETEVTDEQVRQQYDQIQQQSGDEGSVPPFEEIEEQLRAQLEQQAQSGNLSAAFDQLRSEAEIEELI